MINESIDFTLVVKGNPISCYVYFMWQNNIFMNVHRFGITCNSKLDSIITSLLLNHLLTNY